MNDLLDNAPCGFFSFGEDGVLRYVNTTLCQLLDITSVEIVGKKLETILSLPSRIFYQTHFFPLIQMAGKAEEIYLTLLAKNNDQVPILLNASKHTESKETFFHCAFITVWNRKKFEAELVAARKKAESALKENEALRKTRLELEEYTIRLDRQLSLVTKFNDELMQINHAANHELQEPLRKIRIFSQMLAKTADEQSHATIQNAILRLTKSTEQLGLIVSGLEQFTDLQESTIRFCEIDLSACIQAAINSIKTTFGAESIHVSVEPLPKIVADPAQIQLLFYHLFSNCVKFRKDGQPALVEIAGTHVEKNSYKELPYKYKFEPFIQLRITDHGVGFDQKYANKVFELFKRLHSENGRGIGLALAKKIVEKHNGFIEITSNPGVGTTVFVALPFLQR